MWVADSAYPSGERLAMTREEEVEACLALLDEFAGFLDSPDPIEARAGRVAADAVRLLRRGVDAAR